MRSEWESDPGAGDISGAKRCSQTHYPLSPTGRNVVAVAQFVLSSVQGFRTVSVCCCPTRRVSSSIMISRSHLAPEKLELLCDLLTQACPKTPPFCNVL
jgi:hypothetical protein